MRCIRQSNQGCGSLVQSPTNEHGAGHSVKITVMMTIEVDTLAWNEIYGTEIGTKAMREDVRRYVNDQIWGSAAADAGAITYVDDRSGR